MNPSNSNHERYTIELLSPSNEEMAMPPMKTYDILSDKVEEFQELSSELFSINNLNQDEHIIMNKMKNYRRVNVSIFTKYTLEDDTYINLSNMIVKISDFSTKKTTHIQLFVTAKKMQIRALLPSKFVNFDYAQISKNTGILFLIVFKVIFIYKITQFKDHIQYEKIFNDSKNDSTFVLFLGSERKNEMINYHVLLKPNNKFVMIQCSYKDNKIEVSKKEGDKDLSSTYKFDRFTLTSSPMSLFVEKQDNVNVLVDKNNYSLSVLKCPIDLTTNAFFIFSNDKGELFLFTDSSNDKDIKIEIYKITYQLFQNYYFSNLVQTINIKCDGLSRHIFNMTNEKNFDIFLGDEYLIFELDITTKLVSKIFKVNIQKSVLSKKFDFNLYDDEDENMKKLILSVYKDEKFSCVETVLEENIKNVFEPAELPTSLRVLDNINNTTARINDDLLKDIYENTKKKITESEVQLIGDKIDTILSEKINAIEKKLDNKYTKTIDTLNKQYKMIEELNAKNTKKLDDLLRILESERKMKQQPKRFDENSIKYNAISSFSIPNKSMNNLFSYLLPNNNKGGSLNINANNCFNTNNINSFPNKFPVPQQPPQFPQNYISPQLSQMIQQQQYSNPNMYLMMTLCNQMNSSVQLQMAHCQLLNSLNSSFNSAFNKEEPSKPMKDTTEDEKVDNVKNDLMKEFENSEPKSPTSSSENEKVDKEFSLNVNAPSYKKKSNKDDDMEGFIEIKNKRDRRIYNRFSSLKK